MPTNSKRDWFPVWLTLTLAVLVASTVALVWTGHPILAGITAVASVLVGLPLSGWLVAGPYLQADMVVMLRTNGGQMPREGLASDGSLERLAKRGVITVDEGTVYLHEERIGRGLAFFIKLRTVPARGPNALGVRSKESTPISARIKAGWEHRFPGLTGLWTHWQILGDGKVLAEVPGKDLASALRVVESHHGMFISITAVRAYFDTDGRWVSEGKMVHEISRYRIDKHK